MEIRRHYVASDIDWLAEKSSWKNLQMTGMVESECHANGTFRYKRRYYIWFFLIQHGEERT